MKALRTIGTVAAMWWVFANVSIMASGPSGHSVGVWVGPWDTKGLCEQARQSIYQDEGAAPEGMDQPHCIYQQGR